MSAVPLPVGTEESATQEKERAVGRVPQDLKVPELQFVALGEAGVNFQHESCKLIQANTILNELIKEATIEKYTLSEKIHIVLEQIKKLQAKNAVK